MTRKEVRLMLCWNDDRNPNTESDSEYTRHSECPCDNCFSGRDKMAQAMLRLMDINASLDSALQEAISSLRSWRETGPCELDQDDQDAIDNGVKALVKAHGYTYV